MCVVAIVATAFELAATYFQVKKESYTELKKKKKKRLNTRILNRKKEKSESCLAKQVLFLGIKMAKTPASRPLNH